MKVFMNTLDDVIVVDLKAKKNSTYSGFCLVYHRKSRAWKEKKKTFDYTAKFIPNEYVDRHTQDPAAGLLTMILISTVHAMGITLSQMTKFRQFQAQRACRRQFSV